MIATRLLFWLACFSCFGLSMANATQCTDDAGLVQRLEQLEQSIKHTRLDNGLEVYLVPDRTTPTVAVRLLYKVGARHERAGETGYAHLLEHLLFKGTEQIVDGGHFYLLRSIGGDANATTTYDWTDYWAQVPTKYLERVLWLEADRMRNVALSAKKITNQRAAVKEERALRIDNLPYARTAMDFMLKQWQHTGYGHSILGKDEDLDAATAQSIQNFYNRYYAPNNAVLVVSGDVDWPRLVDASQNYFGNIEDQVRPEPHPDIRIERQPIEARLHDPKAPFPLYGIAWHTVGVAHEDSQLVELVSDMLLRAPDARITRRLRDEGRLTFHSQAFPLTFNHVGLANMGFVPRSFVSLEEIKTLVREEVTQLQAAPVEQEELCTAIKRRQLDYLAQLQTNYGKTRHIGNRLLLVDKPDRLFDDFAALSSVTATQVQRAAQQYFDDNWMVIAIEPDWTVRMIKWLMETLPESWARKLEEAVL